MSESTSCSQYWQLGYCAFQQHLSHQNVFSVASLTIAKDRARLASDTANELIFYMEPCLGLKNVLKHNAFEAGTSKRGRGRGFFAGCWQLFNL
jgi:hypothetical protein